MRIRTSALVAVLCSGVWVGIADQAQATLAITQDAQPTAQELYLQGVELYEAGQLEQAQAVLRRVDELQLPAELRPDFYNTIATIEQKLAGIDVEEPAQPMPEETVEAPAAPVVTPDQSLAAGDAALQAGTPADAIGHYQAVLASDDASDAQRSTASARLAQAQRLINGDATAARRLIALADRDLAAGNLEAAQSKLESVRGMGAMLSPIEDDAIAQKLAQIGEVREAQAAVAQAEADELAAAQAQLAQAEAEMEQMREQQEREGQVAQRPQGNDLMADARIQLAQDKVAEADEAFDNGQFALAAQLYEEAILLDPENEDLAAKLADAQARTNQELRPADPLTTRAQDIDIVRQETTARYEQAMSRATQALTDGQYSEASDAVVEARTVLNANRSAFSEQQRNEMVARAAAMQTQINNTRAMDEANRIAIAERVQAEEEARARRDAETRRFEQVQQRLVNARALQLERKYDDALVELEAALFIDPNNAAVEALRDILQDVSLGTEAVRLRRQLDIMRTNQQILNDEAIIPYDELLTYPGTWPELTQTRLAGLDDSSSDSEANRSTQLALGQVVTFNQDAAGLGSIIDYIRDATGANIAVNWPALEISGIDQDTLISLTLSRVPANQFLKLVLEQASANAFDDEKAGYSIIEGIVQISTLADLKTSTEVRIYDIRDLLVQVPNFTNAPEFDLNEALSNTNSGDVPHVVR